jgi:hypothetical protein
MPNQEYKYTRFVLTADLSDTNTGVVFFPFKIEGREGHLLQSGADYRAIRAAETQIKEEYGKALQGYLSGSIPGK